MANLAIKGHPTRAIEVIQLLEMLGGVNAFNLDGAEADGFYYIYKDNNKIYHCLNAGTKSFIIYTLEEFEKLYPYKVGDKVNSPCRGCIKTITSMWWDTYLNAITYKIDHRIYTNIDQLKVVNDLQSYKEETMEEKITNKANKPIFEGNAQSCNIINSIIKKIDIPKDYEFVGIDDNKIILTIKQPQYPKNYDECCEVLFPHSIALGKVLTSGYNCEKLKKFGELLICRDAYWKVYGEQMGLGKPWEPDWKDYSDKYFICYLKDELWMSNVRDCNRFLVFPTEETRDTFYENFKDLINECKELL